MDRTAVAPRLVPLVLLVPLVPLLVLGLAAAALLASASAALAAPLYAPEQSLATGPSAEGAAQLRDTGLAAWEDDAAGDWDVVLDATLGDPIIAAGRSNQRHPAWAGSWVVYEDDRGGGWDLYAWQTNSFLVPAGQSAETAVATGAGDQLDPDGSGSLVVYEDFGLGNADIALRDLGAGTTRLLVRNTAAQVDPSIEGRWVAWADRRNGNWDIYAFDLKTAKVRQVTANRADQMAPQVGQGRVVYQDRRNGNWDIYEYTFATGKERRLTSATSDQTAPRIDPRAASGGPADVVYVQGAGDAADIYLRVGLTGGIKPVCTEPGAQTEPDLISARVVWTDARGGTPDAYAATLDYPFIDAYVLDPAPAYDSVVSVRGSISAADPEGRTIRVSGNGPVRTAVTDAAGAFSLSAGRVQRKVTLRVWYAGDEDHLPAQADPIVVKPLAALSRPRAVQKSFWTDPSRRPPPARWAVSGTLRPRHAAGSRAVTLIVSTRRTSLDDWKVSRTVRVAVRNAGSASSYATTISLPWSFLTQWRVQAVHSDADHTKTLSAFSATFSQH